MSTTAESTDVLSGAFTAEEAATLADTAAYEELKQAALTGLKQVFGADQVGDMRARNRRVLTPSSRDGTFRTDEALVVDVSPTEGALFGPGYCRGDIVINNGERGGLPEGVIAECGKTAMSRPVQVEYLHPYWFQG